MPRNNDIESRLRSRIDEFVDEISSLVREAAVDAVRDSFSAGDGAPVRRRKATRAAAPRATGKKRKKRKKTRGGRRVRRSPEDLERLGATVLSHVRSNPGQRLEEIGAELEEDTANLKRPVQLLLAAGMLRTTGQRRGTRYFPAKGAGRGGARQKAGKKKARRKTGRKKAAKKRGRKAGTRGRAASAPVSKKRGTAPGKVLPGAGA